MADIEARKTITDPTTRELVHIAEKYHDNTDGTYSQVIHAEGVSLEGANVTVSSEVEIKNDSGNPIPIQGTAADNAAATGNPVRTGAKYNATPPTYADGDVADSQADVNGNLKVTLATAIDEDIDSVSSYTKAATYTSATADGIISAAPVALVGFYVMASSSGVISLYDNASAASGTAILANSLSVAAGDSVILNQPIAMVNGLYFDLVSGTATVLVLTRKLAAA